MGQTYLFRCTTGEAIGLKLFYPSLEGLAYRLTPIKSTREEMQSGARINAETCTKTISLTKFQWGGMSTRVFTWMRTHCVRVKRYTKWSGLASNLVQQVKR